MPSTRKTTDQSDAPAIDSQALDDKDREGAQKLMNSVRIADVRLVQCRAEVQPFTGSALRISIQQQAMGQRSDDQRKVGVLVHFRLEAKPREDESARPVLLIEAAFYAHYTLDEPHDASDTALNQFASTNGTFNLWPYWREFVQSMSTRMGLPAITIPSFRVDKAWTDMKLNPSDSNE